MSVEEQKKKREQQPEYYADSANREGDDASDKMATVTVKSYQLHSLSETEIHRFLFIKK